MPNSVAAPRRDRRAPYLRVEPLLDVIKEEERVDFSGYRRESLARRVEKRMRMVGMDDLDVYQEFLRACPEERHMLIDAILIKVTSFFRDAASWTFLADKVIPRLLKQKPPASRVRVWSAGCASGEEAYTLAILLAEAMGMEEFQERVIIHATDLDSGALALGRRARYTTRQLSEVPDALRAKYFRHLNDEVAFVHEELRRRVRFHRHDITSDAPIMHVDLLSCRNTLMYLHPRAQASVLHRFHRSLNDGGILFLGRAETLLVTHASFRPIDLKRRISTKVARA